MKFFHDSSGCSPPLSLAKYVRIREWKCLYSEHISQYNQIVRDSQYASFSSAKLDQVEIFYKRIFISAILRLDWQKLS